MPIELQRQVSARRLFVAARAGDQRAREQVIRRFMPLAIKLARRYSNSREPMEDLVQVACFGLIKAVDRFEPGRGLQFSSFAAPTIAGELKRHFRDHGWAIRPPRSLQEHAGKVQTEQRRVTARTGRPATAHEVAQALAWPLEDVLDALEAGRHYDALSLDAPVGPGTENLTVGDTLARDEDGFTLVDDLSVVAPTMAALSDHEREILHLRFVEDLTQTEIADRIGRSQMHVSRTLRRVLDRLRAVADAA